ncbi:Serine/threonine protein kinase [Parasponia andersonii]|uniref:mitogen-activated protein kinase kinase kinase n=1 Tax=Parasponia andersonii TaxID=3476 RepID=A0A2P5ADJ8_PARAD|nr:Serine/threonine protein kinase [Parasponia andersonii]
MRWLPNISFSSSSPSRTTDTAGKRPSSDAVDGHSQIRHGWRFGSRIKLTRQRKLRHLSDREVSGLPKWSDSQWGLRQRSSGYNRLPARSSSASAIPQPLPLPDISPVIRRKEGFAGSSSRDSDCPLPSPKACWPTSKGVEDRDKDRADHGAGDGVSASPKTPSVFSSQETGKSALDLSERRAVWKGRQNQNGFDNFRLEVPIRSAPTSPFSSPALSPQRPSFDVAPYCLYAVPKADQVWSAPEMPFTDMTAGPPPAFFDGSPFSTECSPTNSPQGKSISQFCKSPNGSSSPYQARLSFETNSARRESSAPLEVHPLPLPPVPVSPSLSLPVHQVTAKPEPVLMKSQWQKGKLIGRGTFGSVYVASNRETGALCAMKEVELFPDDPKSAESIKQLEQVEDRFFIYLEYVHPGSINKYVREHCGAITESVVRNFTRHILSGLAYLHSTKTIHRDIKGANLLVDSTGVVKLADFGMAKHLTGQVVDLSLKGSPYWMAPELMQAVMQKDNSSDLALAVDIWSLGCTIIEMLTGKPPWSEYEGAAAMFKVLKDSPPIPEILSNEGKDFLQCCFRRNPAERPTAAKLLEHRFIKNSHQLDVPSCAKAFSGVNLMDKPHSPTAHLSEIKLCQSPFSLSTQIGGGKAASESETGHQSRWDTSDITVASGRSPRSILETLPSLSPPRSPAKAFRLSYHGGKKSGVLR